MRAQSFENKTQFTLLFVVCQWSLCLSAVTVDCTDSCSVLDRTDRFLSPTPGQLIRMQYTSLSLALESPSLSHPHSLYYFLNLAGCSPHPTHSSPSYTLEEIAQSGGVKCWSVIITTTVWAAYTTPDAQGWFTITECAHTHRRERTLCGFLLKHIGDRKPPQTVELEMTPKDPQLWVGL